MPETGNQGVTALRFGHKGLSSGIAQTRYLCFSVLLIAHPFTSMTANQASPIIAFPMHARHVRQANVRHSCQLVEVQQPEFA